jgi:hypothetical protein
LSEIGSAVRDHQTDEGIALPIWIYRKRIFL